MKRSVKFAVWLGCAAIFCAGPQSWAQGGAQAKASCQAGGQEGCPPAPNRAGSAPNGFAAPVLPASSFPGGLAQAGGLAQNIQGYLGQGQVPRIYGERGMSAPEGVSASKTGGPSDLKLPSLSLRILQSRVISDGVDSQAAAKAKSLLEQMLGSADPGVVKNLMNNKVRLVIIPKDKKLTDIFPEMKGQKTFDGRTWDDVRGTGGAPLSGGRGMGVAVAEENLLPAHDGYPKGYLIIHECSHAVQDYGLLQKTQDEIKRIYADSMSRPEKTGLGSYADSNEREFFAQAAADYFGVGNPWSGDPTTAAALKKANPAIYETLERIYGPQKNLSF